MIELSICIATVAILSGLIIAFVIYNLRQPRVKSKTSALIKQKDILITENTKFQTIIRDYKEKTDEQQKTITKQAAKIGIFSKYTFDRSMGCLISMADSKLYCTACILQFKEIELHTNRNPFQCTECGAEYLKK